MEYEGRSISNPIHYAWNMKLEVAVIIRYGWNMRLEVAAIPIATDGI